MPSGTRASKISSTFDELTNKISVFTRNLNSAESVARKFDSALKVDPKNLTLANQRFEALSDALKNANERLAASKEKVNELNRVYANNKDSATYVSEMRKVTEQTKKFEAEVVRLQALVNSSARDVGKLRSSWADVKKTLKETAKETGTVDQYLKNVKTTLLAIVAGVTKLTKEMANLGKELTANAKKYDTTVEKLQEQSYLFYTLTGNANAYTSSLQAMNSVMAQILSGRGQSQLRSLAQIGLKKGDLTGKSTAEAYEIVFNALRNVEDQATATAVAVKLFGDAGAYVAEMAAASDEEFNTYLEKFRQVGGLSEESAKKLASLSDDLYLLKYQFQMAGAQIIVSMAPAIKSLLGLLANLANFVSKAYDALGNFGATTILISTLLTVRMIPSIIKLIVQTTIATAATWKEVVAVVALTSAVTLGASAVISLASAFATSATAAALAKEEYVEYQDAIESASGAAKEFEKVASKLNTEFSVSTENVERVNSTYKSDITFTIKAEGDTPISEDTAKQVGAITVEQINKALGGIVS